HRPALDGVTVAPMRRRHLRGVLAIEHLVYPRPWSPGLFVAEAADRRSRRYIVALAPRGPLWATRKVVGYAGLLVQAAEAHVTTVAVHPHHHRQKVATRLLLAVLSEAVAMGARAATLEVRVHNRGAHRLYAGFGFAPVGVRPGYYAETGEDALVMWAHGLQEPAFADRLRTQADRVRLPGGSSGAPDLHVPWVRHRVGLEGPAPTDP
ncbi:MAG TPA: ribosomal protein S18-alanine N-acetyltransferase, partial [Egibacteraceae bacterium]|nr:ribosomal protein S18-alanine N-acetyltransferase [Egibacteraceae bacterium]